ncbi:exo-alpha-sialidase [Mucilaginibacter sp.]|jgi:sialidase-1|uniref:sialidase family protein n=1 Tax=Mucilaginibacter sp. TaxID=1882438 RepID=UPI003568951A
MKKHFTVSVHPLFCYFAVALFLGGSLLLISCKKNMSQDTTLAPDIYEGANALQIQASPIYATPINLFTGGTSGYHTYRIPSIIRSKKGTLIAICEGRKSFNSDYGNIDVVCKRSTTNGGTWGALQTITGANVADTWGNPTLVVNQTDGKIWLFMSWNDANHSQSGAGGLNPINAWGQRRVYACYSTYDQDGTAWSAPIDLTSTLLPATYKWDAMGPGIGVQKTHSPNANRLIIPAIGRNIYSDDNGATWAYSTIPGTTSEGTIVEKLNGTLIRNDRSTTSDLYRRVSTGQIGSWTNAFANDTELPDPRCQASTIRYNDPQPNRIFFMNSNSQTQRRWPTIRITYDEGGSWAIARAIPQNGTGLLGGYTSLVKTADLMTGALMEYNTDSTISDSTGHRSIQFHKFNLPWILNGATEPIGY